MGQIVVVFVLLFVTAALWHGGRTLTRSREGRQRLGDLVGAHPTLTGTLLLLAVALLIALGLFALLFAIG